MRATVVGLGRRLRAPIRPGGWAAVGTAALSLVLAAWALRLWRGSFDVPLRYSAGDDTLYYLALIKGMAQHGWWFTNSSLGAPFGQQLFDFPASGNTLNLLALRLLSIPVGSAGGVLNVFYLLTYPLDALAAYWVMRKLDVSPGPAMVCSVLFALLPYHLFRGDSHVFLSAYYALPLAAYLFMSVLSGEELFARGRIVQTLAVCVAVALDDLYYAVFALLLLLAGLLLAALARRPRRALAGAIGAWGVIAALVVAALAPTLVYQARHGSNPVVSRTPASGDGLALSISYLVLPSRDDRISPLRNVTRRYERATPRGAYCETCHEAMGTVADVGFLWLAVVGLGSLVAAPLLLRVRATYRHAAAGAAVCLAVGVTSGLSSLIRVFVSADIRGWNRLSVLIAFFSLLSAALLLDALARRWGGRRAALGTAVVLAGVIGFGVLDQTNPYALVPYASDQRLYASDQAFFADVQRTLPRGAMVFELPYVPFPEGYQPVTSTRDVVPYAGQFAGEYDLVRGYLSSDGLRWSYGAMKGRPADWQSQLAAQPLSLALAGAAAAGFQGLVVDLSGYPGDGVEAQYQLYHALGVIPFTTPSSGLLFYDLRPFARRLRAAHGRREMVSLAHAVLHPLRLSCAPGTLTIQNPGPAPRAAVLGGSAATTISVNGVPAKPRRGEVHVPLQVGLGTTTVALGGPAGSMLAGPLLTEGAETPFTAGPGSSVLTGIVGAPCLDVPTRPAPAPSLRTPFPT